MAEHEGAYQLFPGLVVFFGINHDGKGGRNTLVSTTGVAHDGNHGSGHAGIAGSRGIRKYVGKDAVAHDPSLVIIAQGTAQRVPIISREGGFCRRLVETGRFENEIDFFKRSRHGKIINLAQGERCVVIFFLIGRGRTAIEQHLPHLLFIHKSGVSTGDDGRGLIGPCRNMYFDIKFFGNVFFQFYVDAILGDELFSPFHIGRSDVFKHFELIIGIPGQRTESHGNGQSDHARPGYADPHGVFQDIGTQQHFNFFGFFAQ